MLSTEDEDNFEEIDVPGWQEIDAETKAANAQLEEAKKLEEEEKKSEDIENAGAGGDEVFISSETLLKKPGLKNFFIQKTDQ